MSRQYSKYIPPRLVKYANPAPVQQIGQVKQPTASTPPKVPEPPKPPEPEQSTSSWFGEKVRNFARPILKNQYVQEFIDPNDDLKWSAAQASTLAGALVPGPQMVVTGPLAAATNVAGTGRGLMQMANNWVDGKYDSEKHEGANTQLATDTASNLLNFVPGSKLLKPLAKNLDAAPDALNVAGEMIKRPAQMATSVVGSQIAENQNSSQSTSAPVEPPANGPNVANAVPDTPEPPPLTKTNSYMPRYNPPRLNTKLAEQEQYLVKADQDPMFSLMQPGDNYRDFIRNNIKADLEIGRRRGAFTGTLVGALAGGLAGHKMLQDYEELGKYSPYAGGAVGAVLGAGLGNIAGRPLGMLSRVPDIPYAVIQSMPVMQDAYRKLTQPIFPNYVDPNTYI
jgi:hypothetical protein